MDIISKSEFEVQTSILQQKFYTKQRKSVQRRSRQGRVRKEGDVTKPMYL